MPQILNRVKDFLNRSASGAAESVQLPGLRPRKQEIGVTRKAGPRDTAYRRIIGYERRGPFFRQSGVNKDGSPRMQTYLEHCFLHATKGWRKYAAVPLAMRDAGNRVHGTVAGKGVKVAA